MINCLHSESQSKLKNFEEMYQQTSKSKENTLSSEHMSTFNTVNNLNVLYEDQSKLKKVEDWDSNYSMKKSMTSILS